MWRSFSHNLFLISPSYGNSGRMCFVTVVFLEYFHFMLQNNIKILLIGLVRYVLIQMLGNKLHAWWLPKSKLAILLHFAHLKAPYSSK